VDTRHSQRRSRHPLRVTDQVAQCVHVATCATDTLHDCCQGSL